MATKRLKTRKDGSKYYEFRCQPSRNEPEHTMRWSYHDEWSSKVNEREANKALADFDNRVHSGAHHTKKQREAAAKLKAAEDAKIPTLRQYVDSIYFPSVELSENARSSYESQLRLHIFPVIGDQKIYEITPNDIDTVFLARRASECSHESLLKLDTVLRSVFKLIYAHRDGNPMLKVSRPQVPKRTEVSYDADNDEKLYRQSEPEAYTKEELLHILEIAKNEPLKWRVYICAIADSGIRRGECTALRWSCIDFETGDVLIDRSVSYTKAKGIYFGPPKGGDSRIVTFSNDTLEMLKDWKADQEARGIYSKYIFTRSDSPDIMFPTSPTKRFRDIGKRCGIENFHPHKLRHTFASLSISEGADIASVSEILGHADKNVTLKIYTHSNQERMRKVAQKFHDSIHSNE